MGHDLLGNELGPGIRQLASGKYAAFYKRNDRRRVQRSFSSLEECKDWMTRHGRYMISGRVLNNPETLTVEKWLWYYLERLYKPRVRVNTYLIREGLFRCDVIPAIGNKKISEVRSDNIQRILSDLHAKGFSKETLMTLRKAVFAAFEKAVEFELIKKNPVNRLVVVPREGYKKPRRRVLSREEQLMVVRSIQGSVYYNPIVFMLMTGVRIGEMMGLRWSDVDFQRGTISINQTLEYNTGLHAWRVGPPKSECSKRTIPMNEECRRVLLKQRAFDEGIRTVNIQFADLVFLMADGMPRKCASYSRYMHKVADKLGVERFPTHALRHTYATRCIEAGMPPKSLQVLLGHASVQTTMNKYVHVSEEERIKEILSIEDELDFE